MASKYRLPNRAQWIQQDMQNIINQMLETQQGVVDSSREIVLYAREKYKDDPYLWLLFVGLSLNLQQLNIKISLIQQMNHDLATGDYKKRDEYGHITTQSTGDP